MYGSGFGFGSPKSTLLVRLALFKTKHQRLNLTQAEDISREFQAEFAVELRNDESRANLMLAMVDCYFPASAALDCFKRFSITQSAGRIQEEGVPLLPPDDHPSTALLDPFQQTFGTTLVEWLHDFKGESNIKTPLQNLGKDFGLFMLSLLACSGGSYNKEARILFGCESLPIQDMSKEEQPLGAFLGFSGALWLLFLYWISEGKVWKGASSKGCNYIMTGVIICLGAITALPGGVIAKKGFGTNYAELFGHEPPDWMVKYDVAMVANMGMNARLAVANLNNMFVGGEIVVRSIRSQQGWYRARLLLQMIIMLFISVLCNVAFIESGTLAPVVKDFDSSTKKHIVSVLQNIPNFMLLMMPLMFNSPFSAWRHDKDNFVHFCMLLMILGGLMDGVLTMQTFHGDGRVPSNSTNDGYGMSKDVSLGLSWFVTVFATAALMPMGAALARKLRGTYDNVRALCCNCQCCSNVAD